MCTVFYEWILILLKIYVAIFIQKLGERRTGIPLSSLLNCADFQYSFKCDPLSTFLGKSELKKKISSLRFPLKCMPRS